MDQKSRTRRAGGAAGLDEASVLAGCDGRTPKKSPIKSQAAVCPIIIGTRCKLIADLLAEAVEISMGYGVNVLSAIRLADDAAALSQFKDFDAANRTARWVAEELREARRHFDTEGAP